MCHLYNTFWEYIQRAIYEISKEFDEIYLMKNRLIDFSYQMHFHNACHYACVKGASGEIVDNDSWSVTIDKLNDW